MPFKTKKKKIAAAARHYTFSQTPLNLASLLQNSKPQTAPSTNISKTHVQNQTTVDNLGYVKHDLLKIVVLATLLIAIQIILSRLPLHL